MAEFAQPEQPAAPRWTDEHGNEVSPGEAVRLMHDAFESLLDEVWRDERDWRFNDRLDLATRSYQHRERDHHRCVLPGHDRPGLVFNCPECGLHWERGTFAEGGYSQWVPK